MYICILLACGENLCTGNLWQDLFGWCWMISWFVVISCFVLTLSLPSSHAFQWSDTLFMILCNPRQKAARTGEHFLLWRLCPEHTAQFASTTLSCGLSAVCSFDFAFRSHVSAHHGTVLLHLVHRVGQSRISVRASRPAIYAWHTLTGSTRSLFTTFTLITTLISISFSSAIALGESAAWYQSARYVLLAMLLCFNLLIPLGRICSSEIAPPFNTP